MTCKYFKPVPRHFIITNLTGLKSWHKNIFKKIKEIVIQKLIYHVSFIESEVITMTDVTQILSDILNGSANDSANLDVDVSDLL
ncbi:hypothetical protein GCM10007063_08030 [Lentibacillus kapialis]|uniref:Uncharacterized protein n=1 Tax=Lentibacillus kapialis TaxID=340214 RepID=A0A917PQK1_9BACI|nr:hypothetical protein GCM10007063_08030 [Lentibacillus kapialis]